MERIQRNLDATWGAYCQELRRFAEKNGTAKVPKRYVTDDGLCLGVWLQRQRALYNEDKLEDAKARRLEAIGVEWDADSDRRFAHWMELLKKYKDERGDLAVPGNYETEDGERLGSWCSYIRGRNRKGKLSKERVDALEKIGFAWETFALHWEDGYKHAVAYYAEHGDLDAPKRYACEDGFKLGLWLYTQRAVREGRVPGNLAGDKIKRLDAIGMVWSGKGVDRFDKYLEAFGKYRAAHSDAAIPFSYVDEDGMRLGQWAARMNRQRFAGKLPQEKRERLLEAGFQFHSYSKQWLRRYQEAKAFYDEHGDLHVPASYAKEHGGALSQWINSQRREYRKEGHGKLGADQVEMLEKIHIESGGRFERSFERGIEAYKEYVEECRDNLVPSEYTTKDGYKLGRWLCHQRTQYNKGALAEERVKALEEIGMEWESAEAVRAVRHWHAMYETAKEYADEHGSLKGMPLNYTTADGRKLGSWVVQQRRIRKGTIRHSVELDERKIGMLDALGMSWGRG